MGVNLFLANLSQANLENAYLAGVNLFAANLKNIVIPVNSDTKKTKS